MKTEKGIKVQIHNFPDGLINAIRDEPDWELKCITENPEINQYYNVLYRGKKVIGFTRLHGFEFGSNACYPFLRWSVIWLLQTVINVNIWDKKECDLVVYKEDYIK